MCVGQTIVGVYMLEEKGSEVWEQISTGLWGVEFIR